MSQLALPLRLAPEATFPGFFAGPNAELLEHLQRPLVGRATWVWGSPGLGKSHLLQAACHFWNEMGDRVMYLPMGELGDQGQAYLDGLENLDLVAIDDLEVLLEGAGSERSLFRLHNELLAGGGGLLLASERGPAELPVALADLSSRLAGGLVYRLKPLDTAQQSDALRQRARVNGLSLPEASARYLLARVDRSMASLCRWLDTLDREALASHRQLTVPFIRQVLRAAADGQNDQGDLGGRR